MLTVLRLRITNYFENLMDQVDIKRQDLMVREHKHVDQINAKRDMLYAELKRLQTTALRNFYLTNLNNYKDLSDEVIDDMIFKTFGFTLDKNDLNLSWLSEVDSTYGYLVVLDRHLNQKNLSYYKEFLGFSKNGTISSDNRFFRLSKEVRLEII